MKKSIVLAAMIAVTGIVYCPLVNAQEKRNPRQSTTQVESDESMININDGDEKIEIRMKAKTIVELRINGELIAKEDYPKYESKVQKILAKVDKDRKLAEEDRRHAEIEMGKAEKQREQAMRSLAIAEKQRGESVKDRERVMRDMEKAKAEYKVAQEQMRNSEEDRKRVEEEMKLVSKRTKDAESARQEAAKARANAEVAHKHAEEDRKLLDEIFEVLIEAKVVGERDEIKTFEIDKNELQVNGVKQTKALQSRLLKKIADKGHDKLRFVNDENGTRLSVDN